MAITPDTKDWTWVLTRPCPQCRLEAGTVTMAQIPTMIDENVLGWVPVLKREDVRDRPSSGVWSPLEYGAHVRDVFVLFTARLQQLLTQENPLFENWDQDATAQAQGYRSQDPAMVLAQLQEAGGQAAAAWRAVRPEDYLRAGRRSDGKQFSVVTLGQYFVHDPVHHLWDVTHRTARD